MSVLDELPDDYARADALVNVLIDRATGSSPSEEDFTKLRRYFIEHPVWAEFLPRWFASKRSLNQFWNFIKNRYSTYAERRTYLWSEFEPLISRIEKGSASSAEHQRPLPQFNDGEVLTAAPLNEVVRSVDSMNTTVHHDPDNTNPITVFPLFQKRQIPPDDNLVFTLMPFTAGWSAYVWRHEIKPLVEGLPGYSLRCLRADDLYGADVMQDIYNCIVASRLVIADITGRNPNVLYELGIAHTIGKDVILLSQGTEHIPFDLQRFRHCIYSDDGPGYQRLREYIPGALRSILERSKTT